jgi:hypothetical protein
VRVLNEPGEQQGGTVGSSSRVGKTDSDAAASALGADPEKDSKSDLGDDVEHQGHAEHHDGVAEHAAHHDDDVEHHSNDADHVEHQGDEVDQSETQEEEQGIDKVSDNVSEEGGLGDLATSVDTNATVDDSPADDEGNLTEWQTDLRTGEPSSIEDADSNTSPGDGPEKDSKNDLGDDVEHQGHAEHHDGVAEHAAHHDDDV